MTEDQENVEHANMAVTIWAMLDDCGQCLESWWVGEAKFRLSGNFSPPTRHEPFPTSTHAIARGVSLGINASPGDSAVMLPVHGDKSFMAIAFP